MLRASLHHLFALTTLLLISVSLSAQTKPAKSPSQQHFVENIGQVKDQYGQSRNDIAAKASAGKGLNLFIGSNAIHYQWAKAIDENKGSNTLPGSYQLYRMDVQLLGANPHPQLVKEQAQSFYERYYLPGIAAGSKAAAFGKLIYKNVYPYIDWVIYYNAAGKLEYDFAVRPGGNPADIRIKYAGADRLALNSNGSLSASTPSGTITEQAPYSYDEQGRAVAVKFNLDNDILSFTVSGHYTGILTIDPTVEWATYFGDVGQDIAYSVKSDASENTYITGVTSSTGNIATTGAYQTTYAGGSFDAFISRFGEDGSISWATYYGGDAEDRGTDLALNPVTNTIFIAGVTQSASGIATANAHQEAAGGSWDAFLANFDTAGNLVWGTYYGGSASEGTGLIAGVSCDKNGYVFLSGETSSDDGIATTDAYQVTRSGGVDAFLAKFDTGGQLQWGTYFGGDGNEYGRKSGCDTAGNIYLGGYTNSASGIASGDAFQASFGGVNDAFLAKFNTNGGIEWGTYFGGTGSEVFNTIAVADDGTSYIGGTTTSNAGIASDNVFQSAIGGSLDGYIASFSATGQQNWASYIGGSGADVVNALSCKDQSIYVAGMSNSSDSISFGDSYQQLSGGTYDCIIIKLNDSGQGVWGTYFGGTGGEFANALTVTANENLYITGQTSSAADIATTGSHQEGFGGGAYDAYLIKLNVCEPPAAPAAIMGDTLVCSGSPSVFSVAPVPTAISYTWILPSGWSGNSDSSAISITTGDNSGIIYVVANGCTASDTAALHITVALSPEPHIVQNGNILNTAQPYDSYQWNLNGLPISGATGATCIMNDTGSYSVTVTNDAGCSSTSDPVQHTTGVAGITLKDAIKVYPNPSADMLYIQSPVRVNISLKDIAGREILSQRNSNSIAIGSLSDGIYLLQIYDKKNRLIKVEQIVKRGK